MDNKWLSVILIYAYGLIGASALGMMGPLAADIGRTFNVTPSDIGVAIAGQLLPLAFGGLLMGWLSDRIGPRPLLIIGILAMGVASLANSWLGSFELLRITLLVEGIALVALNTAGQGLLMMFTSGKRQVQALTLWSTVMPVGYAVGLLLVSPYAGTESWREAFLCHAVISAVLFLAFPFIPRIRIVSNGKSLSHVVRNKRVVRFGISLSLSALAGVGSSAVGAVYLNQVHGLAMGLAAQSMAVASFCGVVGSILTGVLLTRGWSSTHVASFILSCAILGGITFYWPGGIIPLAIVGAILLQLSVGGFIALVFSLLPGALSNPGQSGSAAGLVGQITGIGATISAPLFFAALETGSWYYFLAITVVAWVFSYAVLPVRSQGMRVVAKT
ncbi:nitrate/nitrite transporter [Pseudomonas sp. FP2300]|uniref:MFS transporter n=1 Tax=Pseudomonas sp. FP2300 TaxID=2954090 RepID=UPI002735E3E2|nr:MFS transporter [Pseudomonas sp. FP2300]WLH65197.1 MFS transporter [Pseudomonas sp. FP2300]